MTDRTLDVVAKVVCDFDAAISHLRESQQSLGQQIMGESEPEEHLLTEIQEIARKPDDPDGAKVFVLKRLSVWYCYPFAVEGNQNRSSRKAEWASSAEKTGEHPGGTPGRT